MNEIKTKSDERLISDLKELVVEERKVLTSVLHYLKEVEERLGVSNRFVRLEIERRNLATIKLGRRRLVDAADLDEYIARHREGRAT